MTQYLPPNLLALFAPRDPIPHLPPVDKLTWEKPTDGYSGVASIVSRFELVQVPAAAAGRRHCCDTVRQSAVPSTLLLSVVEGTGEADDSVLPGGVDASPRIQGVQGEELRLWHYTDPKDTPPPTRVETREERLERKRREKAEQMQYKLEQEIALWDPHNNEAATTDPYKSLFVSRINYDSSESKLRREFEIYGPIKKIVLIHNVKTGKPRGYAFIEYEHERDMHCEYPLP
ncbi:U1 small nuclear ribonucleoprotein [Chionoecetes opilio]|uniref:U1 small nuclear ribonucleoprotein 70 kDa n=1 Tax=Chionoecetes opilio TaxID=41210 RepID=A0A8J5D4U8_CHIOP|nr:U1 small nuclear ribonucleoprotein [Chionoecetes opilio]